MITSYRQLPLGLYEEILRINADTADELERQARIIAVLDGTTYEQVLDLPLADYAERAAAASFLAQEDKGRAVHRLPDVHEGRLRGPHRGDPVRRPRPEGPQVRRRLRVRRRPGRDPAAPLRQRRAGRACFFFRCVEGLNRQFPNLFPDPGEATEGEGGEGDAGEDSGGGGDTFDDRWGWTAAIDRASETARCSWDAMLEKPAVEFLNILCYRIDRDAKQKADIERWKKTH